MAFQRTVHTNSTSKQSCWMYNDNTDLASAFPRRRPGHGGVSMKSALRVHHVSADAAGVSQARVSPPGHCRGRAGLTVGCHHTPGLCPSEEWPSFLGRHSSMLPNTAKCLWGQSLPRQELTRGLQAPTQGRQGWAREKPMNLTGSFLFQVLGHRDSIPQ